MVVTMYDVIAGHVSDAAAHYGDVNLLSFSRRLCLLSNPVLRSESLEFVMLFYEQHGRKFLSAHPEYCSIYGIHQFKADVMPVTVTEEGIIGYGNYGTLIRAL